MPDNGQKNHPNFFGVQRTMKKLENREVKLLL